MAAIADQVLPVTGRVDTHADVHVAAVVGCWAPRRFQPTLLVTVLRWRG